MFEYLVRSAVAQFAQYLYWVTSGHFTASRRVIGSNVGWMVVESPKVCAMSVPSLQFPTAYIQVLVIVHSS